MRALTHIIICLILPVSLIGKENIFDRLQNAPNDSLKLVAYQDIYDNYKMADADSAICYMQQGLAYFTASRYDKGRGVMLSLLGEQYGNQGLTDLSLKDHLAALDIYNRINYQDGIASVHVALGVIEGKKGNYGDAIKHFLTALKIFNATGNANGQTSIYLKLGVANEFSGNYDQAVSYYQKALAIAIEHADSLNMANIYNNIGAVYCRKEDFNTAAVYLQKSLAICSSPQLAHLRILPLTNLGDICNERKQSVEAMHYFEQALDIAKKENLAEDIIRLTLDIANVTAETQPQAALDSMGKALQMAQRLDMKYLETEVMGSMIFIYRQQKDFEHAFTMLERQKALEDSLFNLDKVKQIAAIQSAFQLEQANTENISLKSAQHKNNILRNIMIVIACLLAVALGILISYYRRTQRLNSALRKRERELERANKVKDRLFSIIGHDLRGPVATIPAMVDVYMDPSTTDDEREFMLQELREAALATLETLDKLLNWGKSLIKGVTTNQVVYRPSEYLQSRFKLLKGAADKKDLTFINNIPDNVSVFVDPEHFKFILRNLVSNAIKFSYPGQEIELNADTESTPGYVIFCVKDSGIGMDTEQQAQLFTPYNTSAPGTADEGGNGIGLMLCMEFVQENGGSIWVKSEKGKGSTFYFSLKKAA